MLQHNFHTLMFLQDNSSKRHIAKAGFVISRLLQNIKKSNSLFIFKYVEKSMFSYVFHRSSCSGTFPELKGMKVNGFCKACGANR